MGDFDPVARALAERAYRAAATKASSNYLFDQTASVTLANSVAETSLIGTGVGSLVFPADFLVPGRSVELRAFGYHSASGNPTIQVKVKFGSVVVLDTGAQASGNSSNAVWDIRSLITCRSAGVGGSVMGQGFYQESAGGVNLFGMVNTSPVTVDTTGPLTVDMTAQWGTAAAGNTITCTNLSILSYLPG